MIELRDDIKKKIAEAGLDVVRADAVESMLHHNSVIIFYDGLDELIKGAKALNVRAIFVNSKGSLFFVAGGTFYHLLRKL